MSPVAASEREPGRGAIPIGGAELGCGLLGDEAGVNADKTPDTAARTSPSSAASDSDVRTSAPRSSGGAVRWSFRFTL